MLTVRESYSSGTMKSALKATHKKDKRDQERQPSPAEAISIPSDIPADLPCHFLHPTRRVTHFPIAASTKPDLLNANRLLICG